MYHRKRMRSSLAFILIFALLIPTPTYAALFGSEAEAELKKKGIQVEYQNNLWGNDTWAVHFTSKATRDTLEVINNIVPILGPMIKNAYYAESSWEIIMKNGAQGVYEAGGLMIGGKFFEGAEALAEINDAREKLEVLEKVVNISSALAAENEDGHAMEAIKILNYGLIAKKGVPLSAADWLILDTPYIDGIFNDGKRFTLFESGKQFNENVQRFDTYLNIINGENFSLLAGPLTPVLKTNNSYMYGKATEENLEEILFDIFEILQGREPVYFDPYTPFLVDAYRGEKARFEAGITRAQGDLDKLEKYIKGESSEIPEIPEIPELPEVPEEPVKPFNWDSKMNVDPYHNWTIAFNSNVDELSVHKDNVFVTYNGDVLQGVDVYRNGDKETVTVQAPEEGYIPGKTYYLYISDSVHSTTGTALKQPIVMKFTIKKPYPPEEDEDEAVHFPDKNLEEIIRYDLKILERDITKRDLKRITIFYADGRDIKDITGLEYAVNVTDLHLNMNQIADISPLRSLSKLEYLDLSNNNIMNIDALSNLTELRNLRLSGNRISNLNPLNNLTNLVYLILYDNQIQDIMPISDLPDIKYLDLGSNQINDVTAFQNSNLPKLNTLSLVENQISDISALGRLTNLTELKLGRNRIKDISVLGHLSSLSSLSLAVNQVNDISMLGTLTNMESLDLSYNQISDITALRNLINLNSYSVYNNPITDMTVIKELEERGLYTGLY